MVAELGQQDAEAQRAVQVTERMRMRVLKREARVLQYSEQADELLSLVKETSAWLNPEVWGLPQ